MDLTSKMLREVEFRDRLRGYDTDEVDEFLERVAVGVDELHAQLSQVQTVREAQPPPAARPAIEDDDSIKRTLVLAQRTADLAIAEAKAEAESLVANARAEADRMVTEAEETARRLESAAEVDLRQRVTRLTDERDSLEREVAALAGLIDAERARLGEAVGVLASQVAGLVLSDSFGTAASRLSPATEEQPPPPPPPPPAFLADGPEDGVIDEASPDLDLDLDLDLSISPHNERSVSSPSPSQVQEKDDNADTDVDEALWERWAKSGDNDERRAEDPFQFGRTED